VAPGRDCSPHDDPSWRRQASAGVGTETLSRVSDPHDRDSLIYADGAGAAVIEAVEQDEPVGLLAHLARSDTGEELDFLSMGGSNHPSRCRDELYLKMDGRRLYRYALKNVAEAIQECLDRAGVEIGEVAKILLHQANEKMNRSIVAALYDRHGRPVPSRVAPTTLSWLGNSSVATLPTLLDLLLRGSLRDHEVDPGDIVVFGSVGAGMHINAAVYRVPARRPQLR
jgi:3-oxoacyl-[acyl-carrier-protein] synthase-3